MVKKIGSLLPPNIYAYVFISLIIIIKLLLLNVYLDFLKEKEKGSKLKKDVALIKHKMKDEHPERINFYLDKYYKSVGYNPEKTLLKYIALNLLYVSFTFAFLFPNNKTLINNIPFLWLDNIYVKRRLSFTQLSYKFYAILILVAISTYVSSLMKNHFIKKYFIINDDYKLDIAFSNIIISIGISIILYVVFNLSNQFIIIIFINSLIETFFYLFMINKYRNNSMKENNAR